MAGRPTRASSSFGQFTRRVVFYGVAVASLLEALFNGHLPVNRGHFRTFRWALIYERDAAGVIARLMSASVNWSKWHDAGIHKHAILCLKTGLSACRLPLNTSNVTNIIDPNVQRFQRSNNHLPRQVPRKRFKPIFQSFCWSNETINHSMSRSDISPQSSHSKK